MNLKERRNFGDFGRTKEDDFLKRNESRCCWSLQIFFRKQAVYFFQIPRKSDKIIILGYNFNLTTCNLLIFFQSSSTVFKKERVSPLTQIEPKLSLRKN